MTDPAERLVNLALLLASKAGPLTAEQIRARVEGYPPGQDEEAFLRMFERDKDQLREAGFAIGEIDQRYRIDPASTFSTGVELSAEEAAAIRAVGAALLDDPAFPFAEDLRLALAKIATYFAPADICATTRLVTEQPERQGALVASLDRAATARKRVTFGYTNQQGDHKSHDVEPFGVFARDGRWYLVARDTALDEVRVYAVARIVALEPNPVRPKTPDFERPADFDVGSFIGLPFQYGAERFEAVLEFSPEHEWRAPLLAADHGALDAAGAGLRWRVTARNANALLGWVVENGPGITVVEPEPLAAAFRERAREVASLHG